MASLKKKFKRYKKKLIKNKSTYLEVLAFLVVLIVVFIFTIYSLNDVRYNVVFNSNGGTTITSKKIKHDSLISEPIPPTKDGYIFLGWYWNDELYDFNTPVTSDIKLEARWELIEIIEKNVK